MMNKRIGIVTNGVTNNEFGGTHVHYRDFADYAQRSGHQVTLCSFDSALALLPTDGTFISLGKTYSKPKDVINFNQAILAQADSLKQMDVLHSDNWLIMPALYKISQKYNIPYIMDAHGSLFNVDKVRNVYKWFLVWRYNPTHIAFVDHNSLADYQQTYRRTNCSHIPPQIDVALFQPPDPLPPENSPFRLLFASWLRVTKGLSDLLKAMEIVWRQHPDTELWIAGEGAMRTEIEALAKMDKRVKFLGRKQHHEMPALFKQVDLLVYPSHFEGFPRAVLEALACKLPVLTSDAGALSALVDEQMGTVIPIGNVDALAEQIQFLMNNPDHRRTLTERGYEYVRKNNVQEEIFQRLIDLGSELMSDVHKTEEAAV